MNKTLMTLPLIGLSGLAACTSETEPGDEGGLHVSAAIVVQPDLTGIEFRLTPAKCVPSAANVPETPLVFGVDITRKAMPDGTPFSSADDYDAALVAEDFLAIPPGCYGFIAAPVSSTGERLENCAGIERDVVIEEGVATDIEIVFECGDAFRPEVPTNSPPTIDTFEAGNQASPCEATRVCATASDPDHDLLRFHWDTSALAGAAGSSGVVTHQINEDRSVTQCIVVQATEPGSYDIGLSVYDMTRTSSSPTVPLDHLVRIEDLLGVPSHAEDSVTIDATLGCEAVGRSAVVMMTLSNDPGMHERDARQLIGNLIDWLGVIPPATGAPEILVVLDDAHHGEDVGDAGFVQTQLETLGHSVTFVTEPRDGLVYADVQDYDVVWFVNPGHPMEDPQTHGVLLRFRNAGGGVVLQGDDMARFWGAPDMMRSLTYLDWDNNGTVSCGLLTDNNQGENYEVAFVEGDHPVLTMLGGLGFEYGNDIDHSTPLGRGEEVLAWARVSKGECSVETPVVVVLEPDALLAWGE